MKNSIYDTGTEATLIEKFNSYSSPCEESNALLVYLWEDRAGSDDAPVGPHIPVVR